MKKQITHTIYLRLHYQLLPLIEEIAISEGKTKAKWIAEILTKHASHRWERSDCYLDFPDIVKIYQVKKGRAFAHKGSSLGKPILITVGEPIYSVLVLESSGRSCSLVELCRQIIAKEVLSLLGDDNDRYE